MSIEILINIGFCFYFSTLTWNETSNRFELYFTHKLSNIHASFQKSKLKFMQCLFIESYRFSRLLISVFSLFFLIVQFISIFCLFFQQHNAQFNIEKYNAGKHTAYSFVIFESLFFFFKYLFLMMNNFCSFYSLFSNFN